MQRKEEIKEGLGGGAGVGILGEGRWGRRGDHAYLVWLCAHPQGNFFERFFFWMNFFDPLQKSALS